MPPKAAVTEEAPNVYRDSLLGLSLETAVRELIANQGLSLEFSCLFIRALHPAPRFPGLPSDFRDIVMKEFDSQVCLQFGQLATKRKWSISGDISTYKNNIFWQLNCHPVKVTLFGEPAQVGARAALLRAPQKKKNCRRSLALIPEIAGSRQWHSNDFL